MNKNKREEKKRRYYSNNENQSGDRPRYSNGKKI